MAMELYYTSVPKGLFPGSTGFSTVGVTAGMPVTMVQKLESLGGYRLTFPVGDPQEHLNPPVFAHWRVSIGGHYYSILSHICYVGADHQGRFNKFAHHVVVETPEQVPPGPAWVMMQPGVMEKKWTGDPRHIQAPRNIPNGDNSLRVCEAWQALTGDAGWAGMLAQAFVLDATRPACVLYKPGTDILPLVNEALSLLPEKTRWRVTFNTYFDSLPAGLQCSWRFYAAGSPAAKSAAANATGGTFIDLTGPLGKAPENYYVSMARSGNIPEQAEAAASGQKLVSAGTAKAPSQFEVPSFQEAGAYAVAEEPVVVSAAPADSADVAALSRGEPAAIVRRPGFLARHGTLFVVAMFLWPLLVLGAGSAVVIRLLPKQTIPIAQDDKADTLRKELDLNANLARKLEEQVNTFKSQYEDAKQDIRNKETEIASLKGRVDELLRQQQVASIDTGKNRPPVLTPTITENNISTTKPPVTHAPVNVGSSTIKDIHGIKVISPFPEFLEIDKMGKIIPKEASYEMADVPGAKKVSIRFNEDIPKMCQFNESESKLIWKARTRMGTDVEALQGTLFVEKGKLCWKWSIPNDNKSKEAIKANPEQARQIQELLRHATVCVRTLRNGNEVEDVYQFAEPKTIMVKPSGNAEFMVSANLTGAKLNLELVEDRSVWLKDGIKLDPGKTVCECASRHGLAFKVNLEKNEKTEGRLCIKCMWIGDPNPLQTIQQDLDGKTSKLNEYVSKKKNLEKNIALEEKKPETIKYKHKVEDISEAEKAMRGIDREYQAAGNDKKKQQELINRKRAMEEKKHKLCGERDSLGKGEAKNYVDWKKDLDDTDRDIKEMKEKKEELANKRREAETFDIVLRLVAEKSKMVVAFVTISAGA